MQRTSARNLPKGSGDLATVCKGKRGQLRSGEPGRSLAPSIGALEKATAEKI